MCHPIVDGITGLRPHVSRLADRPDIDQRARPQWANDVAIWCEAAHLASFLRPDCRSVRMSAKAQGLVLKEKVSARIGRSEDVLPFIDIAQGGMNSGKVAELQSHRSISQPRFLRIIEFPSAQMQFRLARIRSARIRVQVQCKLRRDYP